MLHLLAAVIPFLKVGDNMTVIADHKGVGALWEARARQKEIERRAQMGWKTTHPGWALQVQGGHKGPLYFLGNVPRDIAEDFLYALMAERGTLRQVNQGVLPEADHAAHREYVEEGIAHLVIPLYDLPHNPEWHRQQLAQAGRLLIGLGVVGRGPFLAVKPHHGGHKAACRLRPWRVSWRVLPTGYVVDT